MRDVVGGMRRRRRATVSLVAVVCSIGGLAGVGASLAADGPGDVANLWVDTNGGSCTRLASAGAYVDAQACLSADAAYGAASNGDTILVREGTYGRQVIRSGTKAVAIRNATGATPVFGTTRVDASNLTLSGIDVERNDDPGAYVATLEVNGANNTFDGVDVNSKFMSSAENGRQGINNVGDRNLYRNGSTYNVIDDKGALIGGTGVTFDNFAFHDVRVSNPLVHNECAFSLAPSLTIRNSRFWNCATFGLFIERGTWFGQPLYCCVTLENNVFEHTTQVEPGSWHYYSLGIHGGDVQEMRNWRVVNNTFETTVGGDLPGPGTVWANNIGAWSCNPGVTYSHNVGTKCSTTDKAVSPPTSCGPPGCTTVVTAPFGWVNPAARDFRLLPTSPAVDRGDPTQGTRADQDGSNRPLGGKPDAGAYEFGSGVLVAGDLGASSGARRGAAAALRRFQQADAANLLVSLGNNDSTRGRGFAAAWRSSFGWLPTARIDVAGALGPTDRSTRSGGYQYATLGMPGAYYVRRLRDAEVIVLDSTRVTAAQTGWLQRTLATPSPRFRMVVLHHPPFSCGSELADAAVAEEWVPLFERHGVRLVLSGNAPGYQRFRKGRVTYVAGTVVSMPAKRFPPCPRGYPRRLAAKLGPAFVHVRAGAGRAQVRAVGLDGRTIDRFRVG